MRDRNIVYLKGHEPDNPPWRPTRPSFAAHVVTLAGLILACTLISVCAAYGAVLLVSAVLAA